MWLQAGRPGAGAALYCASTDFGARNHAGPGRKDQLSLVDVPGPNVQTVAEPSRQVVGCLARARDHLSEGVLCTETVGRAADVERRNDVAGGRERRHLAAAE